MSEYRDRAREAVWRSFWAKEPGGQLGGIAEARAAQAAALDRLIEMIASEERLAEHLEWHCGHGECEHVDVLRQRVEAAQAAIDEAGGVEG